MAINVNSPDFRALASMRGGSVNLPSVGGLGLQALQLSLREKESQRQAALQQAKLKQADEMALRQAGIARAQLEQQALQNQRQNALESQRLGLLQQNQDLKGQQLGQQFDLSNRQQDLSERQQGFKEQMLQKQMAFKQMQMGVEELAKKKKEDLDKMGAFAATSKLALEQAQTPQDAQILRNQIVDEAIKGGYIPKNYGTQLKRMPLSEFKRAQDMLIFQTGKAADLQKLRNQQGSSGDVTITRPDGTSIKVQGLTSKSQNELQKSAIDIEKQLNNLDSLEKIVQEKFLTYRGQSSKGAIQFAEKMKGVPIGEQVSQFAADVISGMDKKEQKKFVQDMQAFANQTFQVFQDYRKQTTGMQAAWKEISDIQQNYLSGQMSFNQYVGALAGLKQKYQSDLNQVRQKLQEGIPLSSQKSVSDMSDEELMQAYKAAGGR